MPLAPRGISNHEHEQEPSDRFKFVFHKIAFTRYYASHVQLDAWDDDAARIALSALR